VTLNDLELKLIFSGLPAPDACQVSPKHSLWQARSPCWPCGIHEYYLLRGFHTLRSLLL